MSYISMVPHPDTNPTRQGLTSVNFCRESISKDLNGTDEHWLNQDQLVMNTAKLNLMNHKSFSFILLYFIRAKSRSNNHSNSCFNLLRKRIWSDQHVILDANVTLLLCFQSDCRTHFNNPRLLLVILKAVFSRQPLSRLTFFKVVCLQT